MENPVRFSVQWERLAAAVAHLAQHSLDNDPLEESKLVKLLYYADCAAYQRSGQPITGTTYIRMPHGPYPHEWHITRSRLEDLGVVRLTHEDISTDPTRHRIVAGANAAVDALTEQDKAILDEQSRRFWKFTATAMAEYSHEDLAWHITAEGEPMPYEVSGIRRPGPPDEETLARGRRIAKRIREEGRRVSRVLVTRDETV